MMLRALMSSDMIVELKLPGARNGNLSSIDRLIYRNVCIDLFCSIIRKRMIVMFISDETEENCYTCAWGNGGMNG